jgi:tRNA(fMet)-specific endonuclease VapC
MYLFDTDHMSLIEHGGAEYERILTHLRAVPPDDVATTIISYEEQTRGWLSRIAQMNTPERQIAVYSELKRQLRNYCDIAVVEFDAKAAAEFKRPRQAGVRIGPMDLKIAAIALTNNATVLTRNSRDFARVPGLKFEDWSV